jgi:hypothetical protein
MQWSALLCRFAVSPLQGQVFFLHTALTCMASFPPKPAERSLISEPTDDGRIVSVELKLSL